MENLKENVNHLKTKYSNMYMENLKECNQLVMNKKELKKLSKSQLINLLMKLEKKKPEVIIVDDTKPVPAPRNFIIPPPPEFRNRRPIPKPRKSVKSMIDAYENNIILPPLEFRDDYKPVPAPRTKKPVPAPRTKIEQVDKALKGYTKSFEITTNNNNLYLCVKSKIAVIQPLTGDTK